MITCLGDMISPNIGKNSVELLEKLGCQVDLPSLQTCCGQPAYNSGYLQESKEAMKQTIRAFEESDYLVSPSGSCISMVKQYPAVFQEDPVWARKAKELASKSYELTQFIVDILKVTDVGSSFQGKIAYHPSCHMTRLLGVKDQPLQLLKNIKGASLLPIEGEEDCCGFGGLFSIGNPQLSTAMVDEKAQRVMNTGADALVGGDMACLLNIGGRLQKLGHSMKVCHISEILNWDKGGKDRDEY